MKLLKVSVMPPYLCKRHSWRASAIMKCHPAKAFAALPPTPNTKFIIFHELVDRFSHRPRFPAAPRPNYRRLAIRHRGDSKKSTHPSPTSRPSAAASHSGEHFYKNADTNRDRPARSRCGSALPTPFVSFPLFTRRRGPPPGWGRRPRERKILTIGKSRIVSQSSVETESS